MAIAISSSVTRWSSANTASGATFVSGSFTPADTTLIVCFVEADTNAAGETAITYPVTGGGLTWTLQVARTAGETTAGAHSAIWTAPVTTGASMTLTITRTGGATGSSGRVSGRALVISGYDTSTPVDTVGASNEGGSATNNLTTTSVTPGSNGYLCVADCEWNHAIAFDASSDLTQDTAGYASAMAVCDGYKACTSGVGVTANLNGPSTDACQHKWCQIIVREAAAAVATPETYRGSAVMPMARRNIVSLFALPLLAIHQGPPVQQTTVTAPRVVPPSSQRAQPAPRPIVDSAVVVAVPLVPSLRSVVPAVTSRPQPALARLVDSAAVPAVPLVEALRVVQPPIERGWQVSESGQYHTPGAAAPQSFVTLGTVLPMAEAAGWQVIQSSQLHEAAVAVPTVPALSVPPIAALRRAQPALWVPRESVTPSVPAPIRALNVVSALPRLPVQPTAWRPVETITAAEAPQSTVTQGTVMPAWATSRQVPIIALYDVAAVVVPYAPSPAAPIEGVARRPQPALWRPVDVAAAILDTMLPQSPWAMPVVRWTPRAQPLVWQAINGVPIPPTPGLPGHATTGHAGLAGTRNIATGRPVWGRW